MGQAEDGWLEGTASFHPASPTAPGTDIDFQVLCYVRHGEGDPGVQHRCSSLSWLNLWFWFNTALAAGES